MSAFARPTRLAAQAALVLTIVVCGTACSPEPDTSAGAQPPAGALPPADWISMNGAVYTVDADSPWAESVAVRQGEIIAVGSLADTEVWRGPQTRSLDLQGGMLLPAFHDAHVHPVSSGRTLLGCALDTQNTVDGLLATLKNCADTSDELWVQGLDFNLGMFPAGNPHKKLLDAILPDRPAYLIAADGHSAWVNSRALELAGITAETPDPPKGVIERDPTTGEATGTLRESAQYLVRKLLPTPSLEDDTAALAAALAHMQSMGITSFIDAAVSEKEWQAYHALDTQGELSARVTTSLTYGAFSEYPDDASFNAALARRALYSSPRLHTDAVKLFVDGVLEGETAALVSPYLSAGGGVGELNFAQTDLTQAVARFMEQGLQVHMHAIGDGAVRAGLDAIESAQSMTTESDARPHIAHLQLVHPDDLARFAGLGVTANFQSLWAYPDEYITEINLPAVGPERVQRMYPIRSLQRAGARIVGGSDWSVSSVNPLLAIETAVRRQDPFATGTAVLNADEAMDLAAMIAAYTSNAAWLMRQEQLTGKVRVGMRADLIVLDRNLFEIPAESLSEAQVMLTVFEGQPVYAKPEFAEAL